MPAKQLLGFTQTDFRLNSGQELWSDIVAGKINGPSIGISPEAAAEQLRVHERFPGRQEMQRSVQISVEPTHADINVGKRTASGIAHTARGMGKIDVHSLVEERLRLLKEEVLDENAQITLDDGSVVIGRRIRQGGDSGPINNKHLENPYLDIHYNASSYEQTGAFDYTVKFRSDNISAQNPRGFIVTTKVFFDGEPIDTTTQEFLPVFAVRNEQIGKFKGLRALKQKHTFHL
jgi:hypothetical protein